MRYFLLILLSIFLLQNARGQDTTLAKFLMIGHAYGSQDTTVPQWKSIIENAEKINVLKVDYLTFLGDVCRDTSSKTIDAFNRKLTHQTLHYSGCSCLYAIGNHDKYIHRKYTHGYCCYGKDDFNIWDINAWRFNKDIAEPITYAGDRFQEGMFPYEILIIDTENPSIKINGLIKKIISKTTAKIIVFLSHRLIWAYSNPRYKHLVQLTNSPKMHELPQVVDFDFLNAQKDKKFYFFAGDLGVNIPLFYDKVGNVTLYATGCGGTAKDNALLAEFKRDTIITSLVHLGSAYYNIEDYTLEKINQMPLPVETISAQQGFKGYQWPVFLGIFALMALAVYMVVKPHE